MTQWIAYYETPSAPIDAPSLPAVTVIAERLYGHRLVRVQSKVSVEIGADEMETARRDRWRLDDGA